MNTMLQEGYLAEISLDEGANLLRGIVVNAHEAFCFAGATIGEFRRAFAAAVQEYQTREKDAGRREEGLCARPISEEVHARMIRSASLVDRTRPGRAPDYWTLEEAYEEWLAGLSVAHNDFVSRHDAGREGIKLACRHTVWFLARRWENPELAAAFLHLEGAISDIQEKHHPELFKQKRSESRQTRSRSRFGHHNRMFAAAILEVLVRLKRQKRAVGSVKAFAAQVAEKVSKWPQLAGTHPDADTIVNWLNAERAKRPQDRKNFDALVRGILADSDPLSLVRGFLENGPPATPRPIAEEI